MPGTSHKELELERVYEFGAGFRCMLPGMELDGPLKRAIQEVLSDPEAKLRNPAGFSAPAVLDEIRLKDPGAFPLCTWLDVYDDMTALYGEPWRD